MTISPSPVAEGSEIVSLSAKIMVASIIFVFFLVVLIFFIYLYTKWYTSRHEDPAIISWRRRTFRQRQGGATTPRRRGLDRSAIRSLPAVEYNPKDFKEGLECSVCLSEVSEGDKIRVLPKCNHMFHVDCIDMWFYSHSTCPLCRSPAVSSDQDPCCETNDDNNNDAELQQSGGLSSSSELDDHQMHGAQLETPALPTDALFLGNEAQASSLEAQPKEGSENVTNAASSSSSWSSIHGVDRLTDGLVIEIPSELCQDCLSSPLSGARFNEDEPRSPATATLRSLKRLLSRGKRVVPSPPGSSSADVEPV